MKKRNPNPRFELYRRLRYQHGFRLTPNAMDTIEQFYSHNIKGSIFHVGMYRAINVVLAILILAITLVLWKTPVGPWVIPVTMAVFIVYNAIHMVINFIQYKNVEGPTPFEDMNPNPNGDGSGNDN